MSYQHEHDYNSQRRKLRLSEYGRNVQNMVEYLQTREDKAERTRLAQGVVAVMASLNPSAREGADYKHKLWDHLYFIAGNNLDVDAPYPPPVDGILKLKPEPLPYPETRLKYRFYGRNILNMISHLNEMEEGENRDRFINMLANFMRTCAATWNEEILTPEIIVQHIKELSNGKLIVNPEALNMVDVRERGPFRPHHGKKSGGFKGNKNRGNFNPRNKRRN